MQLWDIARFCGAGVFAGGVLATLLNVAIGGWASSLGRDRPVCLRDVHVRETPRSGGLAMLVAVSSTCAVGYVLGIAFGPVGGILGGAVGMGLIGVADDVVSVRAVVKLGLQSCLAAAIVVGGGVQWPAIAALGIPSWLAALSTVVVLVAITNAANLIDGLDGLLLGWSVTALVTVATWGMCGSLTFESAGAWAWLVGAALGSSLVLWTANRHPARIFVGDGGAYFFGFLVAALLMRVRTPLGSDSALGVGPWLVCAWPVAELAVSVVRRWARGQPVLKGDADHLHHRLMAIGLTHRETVRILGVVALASGGLALCGTLAPPNRWTGGSSVALVAGMCVFGLRGRDDLGAIRWWRRREHTRRRFARLRELGRSLDHTGWQGVPRWRAAVGSLLDLLRPIGIVGIEVVAGERVVARADVGDRGWASLTLPMSRIPGIDVRVRLETRLSQFGVEHVALLEDAIDVLGGRATGHETRGSATPHRRAE